MRIIYTAAFICIIMWGFSFIAGTNANISEILRQGAKTVINHLADKLNEESVGNPEKFASEDDESVSHRTEESNASVEEWVVNEGHEQSSHNSTAQRANPEPASASSAPHIMDAKIPQEVVSGLQKDVVHEAGQELNQDVTREESQDFSQERIRQDEERMAEEGARAGVEAHRVLNDIATMLGR